MTGWLLDTNILSELRQTKPESKVVAFVEAQPLEQLYISTVTLAGVRDTVSTPIWLGISISSPDCSN